jgi:prepilin-type N-terminal cleavage/methylation domain-containing protein
VRARLKSDAGFGLVELLIAMSVMTIAITAIVAGFSSGMVALANASRTGTAGTLADQRMEGYRALAFDSITAPSNPPTQTTIGPDGRKYEVATTIDWACPLGDAPGGPATAPTCLNARAVKRVAITVRDAATGKTYISETSTFDAAT